MPHGRAVDVMGRTGEVPAGLSPAMTAFFAIGCGLIAAGNYFNQPLVGAIGGEFGFAPSVSGLVVTVGQLGYCLGLLLVVPLGDVMDGRALLLRTLGGSALCLGVAAAAPTGVVFLAACFGNGVASTAVQMLVAHAACMSDPLRRGRAVGTVTGGLLVGIVLAWPVASLAAGHAGWRALFAVDAVAVGILAVIAARKVPPRRAVGSGYREAVASLWTLLRGTPELRRRATMQACLFGAFSLFWTVAPLELAARYGLDHEGIALFGLIGGVGVLVAPLAGGFADRGRGRRVMLAGTGAVAAAFVLAAAVDHVWALAVAGIAVNAGTQSCHVVSQRAVLSIRPEAVNRLNSLYIAIFFTGGAIGSALAVPLFLHGATVPDVGGALLALAALGLLAWERPAAAGHGTDEQRKES